MKKMDAKPHRLKLTCKMSKSSDKVDISLSEFQYFSGRDNRLIFAGLRSRNVWELPTLPAEVRKVRRQSFSEVRPERN